jgi:hypothetical protein
VFFKRNSRTVCLSIICDAQQPLAVQVCSDIVLHANGACRHIFPPVSPLLSPLKD